MAYRAELACYVCLPVQVTLLHLGMRPEHRARDGLWSPCTNLAFVMCAIRGWLPRQGGPNFYLATRMDAVGRRCRPCGACERLRGLTLPFFDECYIVKAELCMLKAACKNGAEAGNVTGFWRCVPDVELLSNLVAGRGRSRAARTSSH